jgi:hypothetical protein
MIDSEIKIYNLKYNSSIITKDQELLEYDCSSNPYANEREVFHMRDFFATGQYMGAKYSGLFSPRFTEKTGLTGYSVKRFINANPGYDVYVFDRNVIQPYQFFNIWEHGEHCHPGLKALSSDLFKESGLNFEINQFPRQTWKEIAFCNYWVGNAKFWSEFMLFLDPVLKTLDRDASGGRKYYRPTEYSREGNYLFIPFILERMFSTFISMNTTIRMAKFPFKLKARSGPNVAVSKAIQVIDKNDRIGNYDDFFHTILALMRDKQYWLLAPLLSQYEQL